MGDIAARLPIQERREFSGCQLLKADQCDSMSAETDPGPRVLPHCRIERHSTQISQILQTPFCKLI